jgi:hypothetical protein
MAVFLLSLCVIICLIFVVRGEGEVRQLEKQSPEHQYAFKHWRGLEYCEILSSRNRLGWKHTLDFTAYNTVFLGCDRSKWAGVSTSLVRSIDGLSLSCCLILVYLSFSSFLL